MKSEDSVNVLKNLFGEKIISKTSDKTGLCLDKSQEDILSRLGVAKILRN